MGDHFWRISGLGSALGQMIAKDAGVVSAEKVTRERDQEGRQKVNATKIVFVFFKVIFFMQIVYFTGQNGLRVPMLLHFTLNSRAPKGGKKTANVAETAGKCFFNFC